MPGRQLRSINKQKTEIKTMIIIAEAGVNHNGSLQRAFEMIDAAADAGVDYVKFQTFRAENLVTAQSHTASYQKTNCGADSQLEMLRALELPSEAFRNLALYCKEKNIGFLSSPFDLESIDLLANLAKEGLMDYMKIPSGEITNLPYLRKIADTHIPVILSSGMSTLGDIEAALQVFYDASYTGDDIILLHCNTEYPTPFSDVNLRVIPTLRDTFGLKTGYSDHTKGIEVPIAAVALGACVIEKHFTLSQSLPGPDHIASLEPSELKEMTSAIRNVSLALGSPLKRVTESERKNISVARKSIVASRAIAKGEIFTEENITVKRPGLGISPMRWDEVIGKSAPCDFAPDTPIVLS